MLKFSSCCKNDIWSVEIIVKMLNSKELWTTKTLHFPNNSDFITFYDSFKEHSTYWHSLTKALLHVEPTMCLISIIIVISDLHSDISSPLSHSAARETRWSCCSQPHTSLLSAPLKFHELQCSSRAARCEAADLMISSEQLQTRCWFRCWLKGQLYALNQTSTSNIRKPGQRVVTAAT